jgi:hypothetical protein
LVKELEWGAIAEGLMGADSVVGALPGLEFLVQGGELKRTREDFLEFLRMSSLGAFDGAIEFDMHRDTLANRP